MNTTLHPTLGYRDARAAISFLTTTLGFEEVAVYEGETKGTIGHAVLRWPAGGIVTLYSTEPDGISIADLDENAISRGTHLPFAIFIQTDDPDALHDRVTAAGATIARPLNDAREGRGFTVRDPEGLYWNFGTYHGD